MFVDCLQTSKAVTASGSSAAEVSASAQRACHFTIVDSLLSLMLSEVWSVICPETLEHVEISGISATVRKVSGYCPKSENCRGKSCHETVYC